MSTYASLNTTIYDVHTKQESLSDQTSLKLKQAQRTQFEMHR